MKTGTIAVFFLLLNLNLFAQDVEDSKKIAEVNAEEVSSLNVLGRVHDTLLNEPLSFSSVSLQNKEQSSLAYGINADSSGFFKFENVPPGNYVLTINYVGYDKFEKEFDISSSIGSIDLGIIYPRSNTTSLNEVKISDYKRLIEQKPDGLVYNADRDGTNNGTTAEQVLRKVPMVTVDLDGNVQLRGSGNIKVLIDGKPSTILAASVKDALRQIPSENIKSVEVITSPGAKYDAEGSAGVINIITKKNLMKGISGSVFSGLNYRLEQKTINGYAGTYLSYRNKKFGLTGSVGAGRWTMKSEGTTSRTDNPGTPEESILTQTTNTDGGGPYLWGNINGDYQFDSLNSINAGVNFNPGTWKTNIDQHTVMPSLNTDMVRSTELENPRNGYSVNGGYTKKFRNNTKRQLDVLAQYSINNNQSNYTLDQFNRVTQLEDYLEKNNNDAYNKEFTIQTDYTHPFKKHNQKLETGVKYIHRNVISDYLLSYKSNGSDFIIDPNRTNKLGYYQQVGAAYGQFSSLITKGISVIGGLRYEYTLIDGNLRDNGGKFNSSFGNLLPHAILSFNLPNYSKLNLSYNQRIERPSITYINPFINYSDPYNIQFGNPELEPEKTHKFELSYNAMLGTSNINLSGFYTYTANAIEAITSVESGVGRTSFENVGRNNIVGANFFGSTRLFDRWMINASGNLYYKMLESPSLNISNNGIQYDFNLYSNFKLAEGLTAEAFGMYSGRQVMLQGTQSGWYYYTVGLKKTVLKGKGDLTLVAENFLTPTVKMKTEYNYMNANFYSENNIYSRGFRVSFNYRFGKMSFVAPNKTIDNDDLKGANDTNQQGTGGGMGG